MGLPLHIAFGHHAAAEHAAPHWQEGNAGQSTGLLSAVRHVWQAARGGMHVDADQHRLTSWKHFLAPDISGSHGTQLMVLLTMLLVLANPGSSSFGE